MSESSAVSVRHVSHRYGSRLALDGLSLDVAPGEIFAILGPNGGGKTTLFRLLSTLIPLASGSMSIAGFDVSQEAHEVRRHIGVVFQSPSLDKKLTVSENLRHQGALYGLSGAKLRALETDLLERFGLSDRRRDLVETLSGGLRRRVELAKGLLHAPRVLLLDEPSTGLDPGARADMWQYLRQLRERDGVTIVLTTHLLEEAERGDRLAIIDRGRLVALDTPDALRATVGGDTISISADDPELLAQDIHARLGYAAKVLDGQVRLEVPRGPEVVPLLFAAFPEGRIASLTLGKPTLEDVFIARTGHTWRNDE